MKLLRSIEEMRAYRATVPKSSTIGFVPTMGGLHDGHAELMRQARIEQDVVVASIYVNSAQFAPHEDLARYPITPEFDKKLCSDLGVDALFMPTEADVYPETHKTYVRTIVGEPNRNTRSEGASRPTFFRGVATVLCKLLTVVHPNALYCGQKDAQQCAVMEALRLALWPRMTVRVVSTVREEDGLAMSSRNTYLSPAERAYANAIYAALRSVQMLFASGERQVQALRACVHHYFEHVRPPPDQVMFELLYVSVCHKIELLEISDVVPEPGEAPTLMCVAAKMGDSRLIDNIQLC